MFVVMMILWLGDFIIYEEGNVIMCLNWGLVIDEV